MKATHDKPPSAARIIILANAAVLLLATAYFILSPPFITRRMLSDPGLRTGAIPQFVGSMHRKLSPRFERWARDRVASGVAGRLNLYDVPSTEWPMFSSVYYLWTTEALQTAWQRDKSGPEPAVYARGAVEAARALIMDPVHHTWVRTHWGDNYMHEQNVFFRTLVLAGLISTERILHDGRYMEVIRDQVETLAAALDASPHGVLEDYPAECYPIDVLAAVWVIKQGGLLTGIDTSAFVTRALRAFDGEMLDSKGLPPYLVDAKSGAQFDTSRGVGNSYVLIYAADLWPEVADVWYRRYEEHFWQDSGWALGFREYPRDRPDSEWTYDVDAGPILAGFSPAANAFGVAAARVNGRMDQAYALSCQVIASCWPLPSGEWLGARILSNPRHAPYLGQTALLYFFSREPHSDSVVIAVEKHPPLVLIQHLFFLGLATVVLASVARLIRRWFGPKPPTQTPLLRLQLVLWAACIVTGGVLMIVGTTGWGAIALLCGQFFPRPKAQSATC